ncbi:MAG: hypothetical protein MZV65_01200 [Chromatiales bacterium]|nr:hypothetical protein [Chromatiales bacterium]
MTEYHAMGFSAIDYVVLFVVPDRHHDLRDAVPEVAPVGEGLLRRHEDDALVRHQPVDRRHGDRARSR